MILFDVARLDLGTQRHPNAQRDSFAGLVDTRGIGFPIDVMPTVECWVMRVGAGGHERHGTTSRLTCLRQSTWVSRRIDDNAFMVIRA